MTANENQPASNLDKNIQTRRSLRSFADKNVDAETLRTLFEAARWAASCFNEQPWRFVYATREEPAEFERLLACLVEFNQAWAKAAPVLMLTLAAKSFEKNGKANRHAEHDLGLALGNLSLQAASLGLHVHEMAGFDAAQAAQDLGVPPEYTVVSMATIGYPGDPQNLSEALREKEAAPRTRKALSEIVFRGGFGELNGL
ncbi:MAG: nitroreductase family protein [bacterium]|nr:nitroreductase family protein [bacterium]